MSISVIDGVRLKMAKTGGAYMFFSIACALFGAVYEHFSHEVFSYAMVYAFLIPLLGGAAPFYALAFSRGKVPGKASRRAYHSALATLTVGCALQGVLEIYGTTNRLLSVYWIAGGILLLCAFLLYCLLDGEGSAKPQIDTHQGEHHGQRSILR